MYKMKFETYSNANIKPIKITNLTTYIMFCKTYKEERTIPIKIFLYKNRRNIWYLNKKNKNYLFQIFPFVLRFIEEEKQELLEKGINRNLELKAEKILAKVLAKTYKQNTFKNFPLNWLKNEILKNNTNSKIFSFKGDHQITKIQTISGIAQTSNQLKEYISKLLPYSFGIYVEFQLKAPYFSKDENEFYIIQNPILKETNFKVPMIRGSSWKGALAHAFREIINKTEDKPKKSVSFFRIFGAGSDTIKAIEQNFRKDNKKGIFIEKLIELILFELGLEINQTLVKKLKALENKNWNDLIEEIQKWVFQSMEDPKGNLPKELKTHRGRAIFYPTYFDRISLEIINPHDRRKRAGTVPIHYEVVPKYTKGVFQLIYIPYDGITKTEETLKEEVKEDLENLLEAVEKLSQLGIGAKTKLGWGRFELIEKRICVKGNLGDLKTPEGWEVCRV